MAQQVRALTTLSENPHMVLSTLAGNSQSPVTPTPVGDPMPPSSLYEHTHRDTETEREYVKTEANFPDVEFPTCDYLAVT